MNRSWFHCGALVALLAVGVGAARAVDPFLVQEAVDRVKAERPDVQIVKSAGLVVQVAGVPLAFGATPAESAQQFVSDSALIFGVQPQDLVASGWDADPQVGQGVMYDPATGSYKFTLFRYRQEMGGIPVFRGELRVLVADLPGYPVVLADATLRNLGDLRLDVGQSPAAFDPAAVAAGFETYGPPESVIWAGKDLQVVEPRLALQFTAENGSPQRGNYERWLFVVDAATGDVLLRESRIIFTDVTGTVRALATEGPKSDTCAAEVSTPMAHATVSISGGSSAWADANGNFVIPNGGTAAVTVTSPMSGHYFTVDNVAGTEDTLSQSVTPPGPVDFLHNSANNQEYVRAQANGYIQSNIVRDFTLLYNPTYPVIAGQTNFPVSVNRNDSMYCPGNAWYDGSSLNFCRAGSSYPNTAFSNVVHHEYGHHLVESAGSGQEAYGEGMGDCVAMLIADDPILGYGFEGNCAAGIRTADNNYQYPCTGEIHECGQLLSGCVWSTRNELAATNPATYLDIISDLTINSILLHTGSAITPQITNHFLTLDDDDADLSNGTPHYTEITTGFGAHNMWSGPPPQNDDCSGAAVACPGSYSGTTAGMTVDGSAACGSSNSTPDVWYIYKPQTSGTLSLNLCASDYDTVLSVHSGCPGTSGNQLACNDDTSWFGTCGWLPTSQSALTLSVTANTLYYIRIGGKNLATGNYVLAVSGPACAPIATCSDGVLNQGEQRIDCGGPCPACQCLDDATCLDALFCDGVEVCNTHGQCVEGTAACGTGTWCDEAADACVAYGTGDFEPDGDVDLADFALFQACFGQDGILGCAPGNLTGPDAAIDLLDLGEFVQELDAAGPH